jgi:23S rRNA (adenine-N6)-dimethyltransferase
VSVARSRSLRRPERWGWHRLDDRSARLIVERAGVRAGEVVVDLGAGTGALTSALVDAGAHVVAVERHPERVATLRRRFGDLGVTVVAADVRSLRWPGRPFRVVANPPWSAAEEIRAGLLRAPRLIRADLVLPRWLVHRWAGTSPRIGVGPSVRAEAFQPPARTGAAVAVIAGRASAQLTGRGRRR